MQSDGPRSHDAAADAAEPDGSAASLSDTQEFPAITDDDEDDDEDDEGDDQDGAADRAESDGADGADGDDDGGDGGDGDADGSDDADADADGAHGSAEPAAETAVPVPAKPRHLRESWPPTAEIVLDLTRDGYDPDARDDDVDIETDSGFEGGDGTGDESKPIGRHRRRKSRMPWLAAGAVAASVTAILVAVGAFGANRGNPDAAPTSTSIRPSLVDTAPAFLPTDGPSDPTSPSPTPTATPTRTSTPTPGTTTTTTEPATTTSTTSAPPTTTSPPTPTPTPTPTGPTVILVPPHQMVITRAPGRCVDVNGAAFTNGNTVQSWSCNSSGAQRFTFNANGTLSGNGVCIAPAGAGAGSPMQVRTCGGANQVWQFRSDKSIYNTSAGLCLNDPGYPATNRQLTLAACTGAASQQWTYS